MNRLQRLDAFVALPGRAHRRSLPVAGKFNRGTMTDPLFIGFETAFANQNGSTNWNFFSYRLPFR
jgi:hypothetical protein